MDRWEGIWLAFAMHDELEADLAALRAAFAGVAWDHRAAGRRCTASCCPSATAASSPRLVTAAPAGRRFTGLVRLDDYSQTMHPGAHGALARAFPLTAAWSWKDDPRPDAELDPLLEAVLTDGTLHLGTCGCAIDWQLVVTGEQSPARSAGSSPPRRRRRVLGSARWSTSSVPTPPRSQPCWRRPRPSCWPSTDESFKGLAAVACWWWRR